MDVSEPGAGWRVCVTRDEGRDGPLSSALAAAGLQPVRCPVLVAAPGDAEALTQAAARLHDYAWVIASSARAIPPLMAARTAPWPDGVRSAAVGPATARALVAAGATPPPIVGDGDGADALWRTLAPLTAWPGSRVLVLTAPGGRTVIADGLRAAGATVDEVEAYRMQPRAADAIRTDWQLAAPDAAVLASPRAVTTLAHAIGRPSLASLACLVAIGETTAGAVRALDLPVLVPPAAAFAAVARVVVEASRSGARR